MPGQQFGSATCSKSWPNIHCAPRCPHTIDQADGAETFPGLYAHQTNYVCLRLRLRHSDDIRDQMFRSALPLFVLDALAVLAFKISGFEVDVRRQSHARWAFGISDPAHPILSSVLPQLSIYPYILCFFVSSCPQPRTAPRLLAWSSGTLGWRRHSTMPPVASSILRRADTFTTGAGK